MAYTLGELSKYDENAKLLTKEDENGLLVIQFYNAFEADGHNVIIASKLIEAVKNGIHQLLPEQFETHKKLFNTIISKVPA